MKSLLEEIHARPLLIIALVQIVAILIVFSINGRLNIGNEYDEYAPNNPISKCGFEEGDYVEIYGRVNDIRHKQTEEGKINTLILADVTWQGELLGTFGKYVQVNVEDVSVIRMGAYVGVGGELDYFNHARNQGEFDSYKYYRNRGCIFAVRNGEILEFSEQYRHTSQKMHEIKHYFEDILEEKFEKEDSSILKAMLLGIKEELDQEIKEAFQKNGIAHILAISGLHISFLCMSLYNLFIRTGLPIPISVLLSEIVLVSYILMVGFSPSAVRAAIMFSFFLIAKILKRSYDMLSAMAASSIVILTINPGYIFDASYILSFAAIISVGVFAAKYVNNTCFLKEKLKFRHQSGLGDVVYNFLVPGILNSVIVSFWAYAVSLPILLCCYYETALYAIILNIIVIPLMSVLLLCSVGMLILTNKVNIATVPLCAIIKSILNFYKKICLFLEQIGIGRVNLGKPYVWSVVIYYFLLLLICLYCGKRKNMVQGIALIGCILLMIIRLPVTGLYMLDVGQGDCSVFINSNRNVYIFDGGSSSKRNVGKQRINPFLKYHGIKRIEAVFISHPDADHMNGILELVESAGKECLQISHIYVYSDSLENGDYQELQNVVRKSKLGLEIVEGINGGYELEDGELSIKCIYPESKSNLNSTNDASLVLSLKYGEFLCLETGDTTKEAEQEMCRKGLLEAVDVLKVAHHGSNTSTAQTFIDVIRPSVALISAGKNNRYGHPHKETIETLDEANVTMFATKEDGQITVKITEGGYKYSISGFVK